MSSPNILTAGPLAEFTAAQVAESAARVAAGDSPVRRLAAPALAPLAPDGSKTFSAWRFVADRWKRQFIVDVDQVAANDAATLAWAADKATMLVFPDRCVLKAYADLMRRRHREQVDRVEFSSVLPGSVRVVVLAERLADAFVYPWDGQADFASWCAVFGVDADAAGAEALLDKLCDGALVNSLQQQAALDAFREEDATLSAEESPLSPVGAEAAIASASAAAQAWGFYRRFDTDWQRYGLRADELVMVQPLKVLDGQVVARLSMPCPLQPGEFVRLISPEGNSGMGFVKLLGLAFDDDDGLMGVFGAGINSGTDSSSGSAFSWMLDTAGRSKGDEVAYGCRIGMVNLNRRSHSRWSSPTDELPHLQRDVPLDVSLAAFGS